MAKRTPRESKRKSKRPDVIDVAPAEQKSNGNGPAAIRQFPAPATHAMVPASSAAPAPLVPAANASPLPVFTGEEMARAFEAYKGLQRALDKAMPDQLMKIGRGDFARAFRKKGYWRAVANAFNLTVEPVEERREVDGAFDDGSENFGYLVTYRAVAPSGRAISGDGSCFAIEKSAKFRCPHPENENKPNGRTIHFPDNRCPDYDPRYQWRFRSPEASAHNVRAHAHTRAYNRAVSNLVGFGEVSAEEMSADEREAAYAQEREEREHDQRQGGESYDRQAASSRPARTEKTAPPSASRRDTRPISEKQQRRLFAIVNHSGRSVDDVKAWIKTAYGYEHSADIHRADYEDICNAIEAKGALPKDRRVGGNGSPEPAREREPGEEG